MVLHVDSEAMYIVQEGACGHIAGHYILSSHPTPMWQIPKKAPNAPILIECKTLRYVVASVAELRGGACSIMPKPFYICEFYLKQSAILNLLRPSRQIIAPLLFTSIALYGRRSPNRGTWSTTGWETKSSNTWSVCFGTRVSTIMQITLPSIIRLCTTLLSTVGTFWKATMWPNFAHIFSDKYHAQECVEAPVLASIYALNYSQWPDTWRHLQSINSDPLDHKFITKLISSN